MFDSGLKRKLLKFIIAKHNAKVGMLLAKRQVNSTSSTLKAETCTLLAYDECRSGFSKRDFGGSTKTINDNSLSIADRHA